MESAWLAPSGRPFAVLRAVVDTADHPLWRPGTLARGMRGLRALSRALPAIDEWAAATGTREVLLGPAIARECDLILVVGSGNPSTSRRPVEVVTAGRDASAYLVDDVGEVDLRWLAGVQRVGIMAGASAAPHLVDDLLHCLTGLGPVTVREPEFTREDVHSTLPREVS
jgi:4-hydroxy-3-methylbut-2-enyl diphosphate reductase